MTTSTNMMTIHIKTPKGLHLPLHFDLNDFQQSQEYDLVYQALNCPVNGHKLHTDLAQQLEIFKFRCRREFEIALLENETRCPPMFTSDREYKKHKQKQQFLVDEAVHKVASYWLYARRLLQKVVDEHVQSYADQQTEESTSEGVPAS